MNELIKTSAAQKGVYLYEVAYAYGCNDGNFSRKLRRELPEKEQERILKIIDDIAEAKSKGVR